MQGIKEVNSYDSPALLIKTHREPSVPGALSPSHSFMTARISSSRKGFWSSKLSSIYMCRQSEYEQGSLEGSFSLYKDLKKSQNFVVNELFIRDWTTINNQIINVVMSMVSICHQDNKSTFNTIIYLTITYLLLLFLLVMFVNTTFLVCFEFCMLVGNVENLYC